VRCPLPGIGAALNALTPVETPSGLLPATTETPRAGGPLAVPELRELRYFAAAARAGNLSRAAAELNVSAAAVSQQLRKLEDTIGTPLLVRHGRGVTATPAGLRLLERADTVLRLLAAPLDQPSAAAAEATVTLALPPELGGLLAAPVSALVRDGWPEVTAELREATESAVEALCAGQTDIALLADAPELDALWTAPVASERLGLVVSPRDALADSVQPLRVRDLLAVPLILPGKRHWIRRRLAKAAFQRGLRFDAVTQVDSLAMTRAMVRDGLGCAVLPRAAVHEDTARGSLVFRPLEQPVLPVAYAIATRCDAGPLVREIACAVAGAMRALAGAGAWSEARRAGLAGHATAADAAPAESPPRPAAAHDTPLYVEAD